MQKPDIGQHVTVRGVVCRIFRIHPCGTIDVESLCGQFAWRVSGLGGRVRTLNTRSKCPHCKVEGSSTALLDGSKDHDRPDGRHCLKSRPERSWASDRPPMAPMAPLLWDPEYEGLSR